jgi:hypothetical protein
MTSSANGMGTAKGFLSGDFFASATFGVECVSPLLGFGGTDEIVIEKLYLHVEEPLPLAWRSPAFAAASMNPLETQIRLLRQKLFGSGETKMTPLYLRIIGFPRVAMVVSVRWRPKR